MTKRISAREGPQAHALRGLVETFPHGVGDAVQRESGASFVGARMVDVMKFDVVVNHRVRSRQKATGYGPLGVYKVDTNE